MPLFELPPEPSGAINRTEPYNGGAGTLTIAAGEFWRSGGPSLFGNGYAIPNLTNRGTLWSQGPSATAVYGVLNQQGTQLANEGLIAAIGTGAVTAVYWQPSAITGGTLTNSGGIYASTTDGTATAVVAYSDASTTNSGTIAARSPVGTAIGFQVQYGTPLVNLAGGRILAEGEITYAAWIAPMQSTAANPYVLDNAGLIAAQATTANIPSIAVYGVGLGYGPALRLRNTGTISGDFAFYGAGSDFSRSKSADDIIVNDPGGVMSGAIWTDSGNDQIVNRGRISGPIGMGDGDDFLDSSGGILVGQVELDFGNDTFIGGAGGSRVFGDRGNDSLTGGSGEDLLVGGRGNDVLIGGAGNDGLYGEFGADRIVTQRGDAVFGGAGDDRIELGDYSFAKVDGGTGFDWLVLPTGARSIDLSAVLASQRVAEIEGLILSGGKRLTLRTADIPLLTGGETDLLVTSSANDTIELVGSWTRGATTVIGTTTYQIWQSSAVKVLVSGTGTVVLNATAATGPGLDAVATGAAAPLLAVNASPSATAGEFLSFDDPLQIDADEVWTLGNVSYPDFRSSSNVLLRAPQVTSYGQITSTTNGTAVTGNLVNYGTVLAQDGPASANADGYPPDDIGLIYGFVYFAGGGAIAARGTIENRGALIARAGRSGAAGIANSKFANYGTIEVSSDLTAVGFQYDFGIGLNREPYVPGQGDYALNAGQIIVSGKALAAGAVIHQDSVHLINAGTITVSTSDPAGTAVGIVLTGIYAPGFSLIENSGRITAPTAVYSTNDQTPVVILNTGRIEGAIRLDAPVVGATQIPGAGSGDSIINTGTIIGEVRLGAGSDIYDGLGGRQTGAISGEGGNDLLRGSLDADRIDGGVGDDLIIGSPGGDTLTGGTGRDHFVYSSVPGAGETITDFVSGVDKLVLAPLAPTSVRIDGAGNTWQVRVTSPAGNFTIAVQGTITLADIADIPGLVLGTYGRDVLAGSARDDIIYAGGEQDSVSGGLGNDTIYATGSYDLLDGGRGVDLAIIGVDRAAAWLVRYSSARELNLSNNTDGTVRLKGIEQVQFSDGLYSFLFASGGAPVVANFNPASGWTSQSQFPRRVADMNGDGYGDIVGFGTAGVLVSYGRPGGTFAAPSLVLANFGQASGWLNDNQFRRALGDLNGDGRADVIGFGQAGTLVSLARPDGSYGSTTLGLADFGVAQGWSSQNGFARLVGDVNGDGKADLVGFGVVGTLVALGRGDGTFQTVRFGIANFGVNQGWTSDNTFHRELADVNGDGRADVIGFGVAGTFVALSRGDGTFADARLVLNDFGTSQGWTSNDGFSRIVADVNGDGVGDVIGFGTAGTLIAFGRGDGTFTPAGLDVSDFGAQQGWTSDNLFHREVFDMNRDGLADIVGFGNAGTLIGLNVADFLI
ncbi:FG-GAP-like repeat-containing protein [Novosphingobium sp.]|uniref:beta strand repeat-containing protein n=1 Tax=Novosphingobium sp. TaxID=1874826 RepID=UPI00260C9ACD|nr:FG-GAP-like repeat-containing protein [Novosphingobium sp.]